MTVIQHKIRRFATIQSDFGHIWEQEAASSSLATPIQKSHDEPFINAVCRGFLCFQNPEIWLECALFVPYRPKKCFHFEDCYISYFCLTFGVHFRAGRLFFIVEIRDFPHDFFNFPAGGCIRLPNVLRWGQTKFFEKERTYEIRFYFHPGPPR